MLTLRSARWAYGAAVLVGLGTLVGCTGGSSNTNGAQAASGQLQAKAQQSLTRSGTDLATTVDALAAPVVPTAFTGNATPQPCPDDAATSKTVLACTGFNAAGPCVAGSTQTWPQRWGYNLNLHLTDADAANSGSQVLRALTAAKWSIHRNGNPNVSTNLSPSSVSDVSATKGDLSLRLLVDDLPGVLNIEAYGPCIGADAKVTTAH